MGGLSGSLLNHPFLNYCDACGHDIVNRCAVTASLGYFSNWSNTLSVIIPSRNTPLPSRNSRGRGRIDERVAHNEQQQRIKQCHRML